MGRDELLLEQFIVAEIDKAHRAYLDHSRRVAAGLAAEAAEALEEGIRDIVDEDAEADAAVQAVLVRQISERAMYAARRVADLEAQGDSLAFGKMVGNDNADLYVGRRTVFSGDDPLLVDWRARAAIPFYRATPLDPMDFQQRRHLLYSTDDDGGSPRLVDYSDEVFDVEQLAGAANEPGGLRGEAALLASLVSPTGDQMRSVVATIQAEQDAVIRASGQRMLIVQGGPGTGKTVVALHRAAYLLYDQRVELADTGVLIVGPSNEFLRYISGVLPSLGESGVVSVTVPRLYRGARLGREEPPEVARVKASADMVGLLASAVRQRQRPPTGRFVTWYGSRRVVVPVERLQQLFDNARRNPLHNDGAASFRRDLIDDLVFQVYDPSFHNREDARETFAASDEVEEFVLRHYPPLTPEQTLNDLLGSRPLLRAAAGAAGVDPALAESIHRPRCGQRDLDRVVWSDADAALLDELLALVGSMSEQGALVAARAEGGDLAVEITGPTRDEADEFELADRQDDARPLPAIDPVERPDDPDDQPAFRDFTDPYIDDRDDGSFTEVKGTLEVLSLDAVDDTEAGLDPGSKEDQGDESLEGRPAPEYDGAPAEDLHIEALDAQDDDGMTVVELAGEERSWQFGHVIVDEAQDLTPMQWRMVARRSSGGGLTVVGDLAQRVGTPVGRWEELVPTQLSDYQYEELTINYRSPSENDDLAASLLSDIAPGLSLARSLRPSGLSPVVVHTSDLVGCAHSLAARHGIEFPRDRQAVIVPASLAEAAEREGHDVAVLTAREAKGLEFDLVIVVEPAEIVVEEFGHNLLYVAATRPTRRLAVVHHRPLPESMARVLDPGFKRAG
jgi:hypothetical protein